MTTRRRHAWAAILLLLAGCSVEQVLIGQWYGIVTPPDGACPRLVWRFVVDPDRFINGYLASDSQDRIATLSGSLAPDDTFQITAVATAPSRSALITGQFAPGISTIAIHGDGAGPGCDGKTFQLRLGRYFATQGGGGGGR